MGDTPRRLQLSNSLSESLPASPQPAGSLCAGWPPACAGHQTGRTSGWWWRPEWGFVDCPRLLHRGCSPGAACRGEILPGRQTSKGRHGCSQPVLGRSVPRPPGGACCTGSRVAQMPPTTRQPDKTLLRPCVILAEIRSPRALSHRRYAGCRHTRGCYKSPSAWTVTSARPGVAPQARPVFVRGSDWFWAGLRQVTKSGTRLGPCRQSQGAENDQNFGLFCESGGEHQPLSQTTRVSYPRRGWQSSSPCDSRASRRCPHPWVIG